MRCRIKRISTGKTASTEMLCLPLTVCNSRLSACHLQLQLHGLVPAAPCHRLYDGGSVHCCKGSLHRRPLLCVWVGQARAGGWGGRFGKYDQCCVAVNWAVKILSCHIKLMWFQVIWTICYCGAALEQDKVIKYNPPIYCYPKENILTKHYAVN